MGDKVDFGAVREAAQKEGLISIGKTFKLQDGDNKVRVLTAPIAHPGSYNGKPNFKWLLYVLDRRDGQVKPMFMSPVIYDGIADLQKDPDYEFSEVPMPFDINIKTTDAGKITARYSVIPSPRRTGLSPEEMDLLNTATPLPELQRLIRAKTGEPQEPQSNGHFDPDEIPF